MPRGLETGIAPLVAGTFLCRCGSLSGGPVGNRRLPDGNAALCRGAVPDGRGDRFGLHRTDILIHRRIQTDGEGRLIFENLPDDSGLVNPGTEGDSPVFGEFAKLHDCHCG